MIHAMQFHVIPLVLLTVSLIPQTLSADEQPEPASPRGCAGGLLNPSAGPLHVFTGVEMAGQYAADQSMKVIGRTGVLWKMSLGEGIPLEVRGGPTVKYNDPLRPERSRDQGSMEWEVKAKCPLIGPFNLE